MNIKNKTLDELYELKGMLEELLILAKAFGAVKLDNEILSFDEVQDEMTKVKAEIASRISKAKLRRL